MTQVTQQPQRHPIKAFFNDDSIKAKFAELLGKRAPQFITSVLQVVASNNLLEKADPISVYQAASTAAILDLPINNSLGFAYIVPYNQSYKDENGNWKKKPVAQFQLGYKGFIQLAQRSGQFKTIAATPIYEGQLIEENPLTGFVFDFKKKSSNNVIGYAAFFQLLNGFEKTLYMTVDELRAHGLRFSQTFKDGKGLWKDDFDSMATKTVLKLLLSKFAPLSVEMQKAIIADQSVIRNSETNDVDYVDADATVVDKEEERLLLMISDCKTVEELNDLVPSLPQDNDNIANAYQVKLKDLTDAA